MLFNAFSFFPLLLQVLQFLSPPVTVPALLVRDPFFLSINAHVTIQQIVQLLNEDLFGQLSIPAQRSRLMAFHHNTGGFVLEDDCVGGFVHCLTTWSTASGVLLFQIFIIQLGHFGTINSMFSTADGEAIFRQEGTG